MALSVFMAAPEPVPSAHPTAGMVGDCVMATEILAADAALLEQHLARAIESRSAMHKAQLGRIVDPADLVPAPHGPALGALQHLLDEHRALAAKMRVALIRAYDCEHVRVKRVDP